MADEIVPDDLTSGLSDWFLKHLEQGNRMNMELMGLDPDNLETRHVELPRDPAFLAARTEFAAKWEELTQEGIDAGYLDWAHCYECAGTLEVTTDDTEWVAEPNPDYDPDKPLPPLAQHVADGKPVQFEFATKKLTSPGSEESES